jgi:hypothetical protein
MAYGYRLFTFEVFQGNKRTAVNLKNCAGERFIQVVERLLKAMTVGISVGDPTEPGQTKVQVEGKVGEPAIRVEEVRVVDNTIRATVWAGRFGSHEKALGDDIEADADISDKAASNLHRVILAFPDDGTTGILGIETIGRSCPAAFLVRWLQKKSRDEATEGLNVGSWWRMRVTPLADEGRLEEMIRDGHAQKLVLVKNTITAGSTREVREIEITASLATSGKIDQVVKVVQGWFKQSKASQLENEPPVTTEQGVRQLAAIVGPQIADMDLDDGWVEIEDPDGQVKRVRPSQMAEVFTYLLSNDVPVVTPAFYAAVRGTALTLQSAAKIAIDWPVS